MEKQPSGASMLNAVAVVVPPMADDGQWTMAPKDYANLRYSGLTQVNSGNIKNLKVAWTFSLGTARGVEAAPVIANNTLYVITPFPHTIYALDLTQPGAPAKWSYRPKWDDAAKGVACCDWVNRGVAYSNGKIFFNTLDDHTIALDANSGAELWNTKMGEYSMGQTLTMAPLVVKDKVLVGNAGGEFGVRGWVAALDANSGRIVWKAYHTGPDQECLIGPDFHPFYDSDKGKDLGFTSWSPDAWKTGGATMWGWISYDPQLNLIYYGTGNPGPWNPEARPGDNKWSATLFARDADTGMAKWAFQIAPHDDFDYDAVNESTLLDLKMSDGSIRHVLLRAERNGYMYVIDRTTGEVLSAQPYAYITSSHGFDLKSGHPIANESKKPGYGRIARDICPAVPGAKDWSPSAFSPSTGLLYVPAENLCMDMEGTEANYIAGTPFIGTEHRFYAGPGGHRGELMAWDPVHQKKAWAAQESFPAYSGVLATAGNLVFYGTMDGWFKALDAKTGNEIWKYKVDSGIISQPVTYRGPDGKQYVAVYSGVGGWPGAIVSGGLDPRDATAGDGFANAMSDLPKKSGAGGTLYVFSLP